MAYGEVVPMPTLPLEFQMTEPGKYAVPETLKAVVDAYVNTDAALVDVAKKREAVGVEVAETTPFVSVARRPLSTLLKVTVPVTPSVEPRVAAPVVVKAPTTVLLAWERKPPASGARPATSSVCTKLRGSAG